MGTGLDYVEFSASHEAEDLCESGAWQRMIS